MIFNKNKSSTILLIGAGGSKPAGGLTLKELENSFERLIYQNQYNKQYGEQKLKVYLYIKKVLKKRLKYNPNFELTLTALQDIHDYKNKEPVGIPDYKFSETGDYIQSQRIVWVPQKSTLHYFFEEPKTPFRDDKIEGKTGFYKSIGEILIDFENHLVNCISEIEPKKSPLKPIIKMIKETNKQSQTLKIFTLNYDTLIEDTCTQLNYTYTDGFLANWNPLLFDTGEFDVNIYKMHGSINWVGERWLDISSIIKINNNLIETNKKRIIIYPLLIKDLWQPIFIELLSKFSQSILDAERLIIIGCSLHDEYIKTLIIQHFGMNPDLKIIIIDKNAKKVMKRLISKGTLINLHDTIKKETIPISKGIEDISAKELDIS